MKTFEIPDFFMSKPGKMHPLEIKKTVKRSLKSKKYSQKLQLRTFGNNITDAAKEEILFFTLFFVFLFEYKASEQDNVHYYKEYK